MIALTERQKDLLRDAELRHTEYLVSLRALAAHIERGRGGRQVSLSVTEAESSGHWLQDAAWQMANLDGTMRADRPWEDGA